ncbi:uncharacterized protein BT62DRAFT_491907 [Guyanagaster necrorhizus]|uniref:Uncharacterized protein n=1 Tax=Guyanagaster necrorhizus TaxID=856835 RepID=A0A9P7W196_9AGAR|nr:uncharacterized protein BT62DRAFT_491907 [Guyanagaster necrorhizus MCA 3950]KAG7450119.1 hypothetical protein BT62DRAFT_491907 [Guyanagaster necrorhizus MCA 3950]
MFKDNNSRSSVSSDEIRWLVACSTFTQDASPSPTCPIPIPSKRSRSPPPAPVGINDSLTLLRARGMPRRNYQRSTKCSRAKAIPKLNEDAYQAADPDCSSLEYAVAPPRLSTPLPAASSSSPFLIPASSRAKVPRNGRMTHALLLANRPFEVDLFPNNVISTPPRRQPPKHREWIYRSPKSSADSPKFQSRVNVNPRPRSPSTSGRPGPCLDHRLSSGCHSNYRALNRNTRFSPPSPPSSFWSSHDPRSRISEDDALVTGSNGYPQWDNSDSRPSSPLSSKLSCGSHHTTATEPLQSRSASSSTISTSSSSPPPTPITSSYLYSPMMQNPYPPRSILTTSSSSASTDQYSSSVMVSRPQGRKRSGSSNKSVKFVDMPTVHYASICHAELNWDWATPDENSDADETESEIEEGGAYSPMLGRILGFDQDEDDAQGTEYESVIEHGCPEGRKDETGSLRRLVSLKRSSSSASSRSINRPSISGPFVLGSPPSVSTIPSPPTAITRAASISHLRSAPSYESFRSARSSGGKSALSVKSLRSISGSIKSRAREFRNWFKGRRVAVVS